MFKQTLPKNTADILALLAKQKTLPDKTYLAGGTALALQIGHRVSYDLDFFTPSEFNENEVLPEIEKIGGFEVERIDRRTILGKFDGCKFSLFYYPYPLIGKATDFLGIKLASLEDLAASKINAISSRGKRRDFVDLFYLTRKLGGLEKMLKLYDARYKKLAANRFHIMKSLEYFADADKDVEPEILDKDYSWDKVKLSLCQEALKIARSGK